MTSDRLAYDRYNTSMSLMIPTLVVRYPHIKKAYLAKVTIVPRTEVVTTTHTVARGESLNRLRRQYDTTVERIMEDNNMRSPMIHPDQVLVISRDEVVGEDIHIEQISEAMVGAKVFLIVETENFRGRKITANVKQGIHRVVTEVDGTLEVLVGDTPKGIIEAQVGRYAADSTADNKEEFLDFAILEIGLKPWSGDAAKAWNREITLTEDKHSPLYLLIDAHTGNEEIPAHRFNYYGQNEGTDSMVNRWLDMDGLWFKLKKSEPKWMETVIHEMGVSERWGPTANPRIMEYNEASGAWATDDSGEKNAWCGSFAAWVMKENGYEPPEKAFRAKNWINFGRQITEPVYGAIGVKSRTGGGHVSFIVGKSEDGTKYYMLGGNQKNKVQVSEYDKDVWTHFMVPSDYDESGDALPIYTEGSVRAGSEA